MCAFITVPSDYLNNYYDHLIVQLSLERPVSSKEKVLDLALTLSTNGKLVVKENHIAEKISRHVSHIVTYF